MARKPGSGGPGIQKRQESIFDYVAYNQWERLQGSTYIFEMTAAKRVITSMIKDGLTETQRNYFVAYYIDQLTMPEIGHKYGVDKSTVSRVISYAKNRIYKALRPVAPSICEGWTPPKYRLNTAKHKREVSTAQEAR